MYDAATAVFVGLGAADRIRAFVFGRSLWLDEASVVLNITRRSFHGLLKPLSYAQGAPVGWLWIEHTSIRMFGNNERALRALPFVCGLLSLGLFWHIARRVLAAPMVPLAVGLFATARYVTYYGNEVKSYETDLFVGLLLVALSFPLLAERVRPRSIVLWTLVGTAGVWISQTTAILVPALAGAIAIRHLVAKRIRIAVWIGVATALVMASFGIDYLVTLRAEAKNGELLAYWAPGLLPKRPTLGSTIDWLWGRWSAFVGNPLSLWGAGVVAVLMVLGLVGLRRSRPGFATMFGLCAVPFLVVACLRKYPFSGRLVLVLVPIALLVAVSAASVGPQILRIAVYAFLAGSLVVSAAQSTARVVRPERVEEIRPIVDYVREHRRPGDVVLVEHFARPSFAYYGGRAAIAQDGTFLMRRTPTAACADTAAIAGLVGHNRVWLIFGKRLAKVRDDRERDVARFGLFATRTDAVTRPGAALFLYDPTVRRPPPRPGRAVRPGDCLDVDAGPLPS